MNPEAKNATQNDIDRYLYHNLPEYHHKKRGYYRQKYRTLKDNIKYVHTLNTQRIVSMILLVLKIFKF